MEIKKSSNTQFNNIFGTLFILTGIFAILGGLYTWGQGNIFDQNELLTVLIPWADIILTGPLSLLCGYRIKNNQPWGEELGLVTSGIYIFGSVLVFITLYWNQSYPLFLLVPAISGMTIGLGFVTEVIRGNKKDFRA